MRNVDHEADELVGETKFDALPPRVQEALGELAGAAISAELRHGGWGESFGGEGQSPLTYQAHHLLTLRTFCNNLSL